MMTVNDTIQKMQAVKVEVIDFMPKPSELPDGTTYGNYSVRLPSGLTLIPYQYKRDYMGVTSTETGFTRSWMKDELKPRKYKKIEHAYMKISRPPLFVRPSMLKEAVYIDIKAAYPSIYKLCGWDVEYLRNKYVGLSSPLLYPLPEGWKVGRSFVVTGSRPFLYSRYIHSGEIKMKRYYNKTNANPALVAFVNDTLCMIGRFATYSLGAVYWNTDGGIMSRRAANIMIDFLSSLNLTGVIKHEGRAEVLSSGYWKVGKHETKNYQKHLESNIKPGDMIPMSKVEAEWLYTSITKRGII